VKIEEIVNTVATTSGMKPADLRKAVDSIFAAVKSTVEAGEKVSISGVGTFLLKSREGGEKVNAKTGKSRVVEASSFLAFKPSKSAAEKKVKGEKKKKE
jgi:nucleoid DNA-binding protein